MAWGKLEEAVRQHSLKLQLNNLGAFASKIMKRGSSTFSGGLCTICGTHFSEKRALGRHTKKCEKSVLNIQPPARNQALAEPQEDSQALAAPANEHNNKLQDQEEYVSRMIYTYGMLVDQYRTSESAIESVISTVTRAVTHALSVVHQELTDHISDPDLLQRAEKKAKKDTLEIGLSAVPQVKRKIYELAATIVRAR